MATNTISPGIGSSDSIGKEIKRAVIATSAADTALVAAVTGRKIRVHALALTLSGGNGSYRFESGSGGTALTGTMDALADTVNIWPWNPAGWFETAAGSLLNLELTTVTDSDGVLLYTEV